MIQLNLDSCYLCADVDCSTVSDCAEQCPRCHSHVISLASVLNRPSERTSDRQSPQLESYSQPS